MTAPSTVSAERSALRPRPAGRFSRRGRLPWWAEAVLAVLAYEIYNLVQAATASKTTQAGRHAQALASVERRLHLHVEPAVNHFAVRHSWIGLGSAYYYALAHLAVTAGVLVFLWIRRPEAYVHLRNGLLSINLLALLVFWLWPVAPPRLVGHGIVDVLVHNDVLGAAHVNGNMVNLYAAMPSLHVAWACWCAAAIVTTTRTSWRYLAWLYPLMTTFVVIATGNHYLLDAVAGAALTAAVSLRPSREVSVRSGPPLARYVKVEDHVVGRTTRR
jgi:hypothetical protein